MKIGIITQPLVNNYGGILQNYALQQVLIKIGHNPITIDLIPKQSIFKLILSHIKTIVLFFFPKRKRQFKKFYPIKRSVNFELFINENIRLTKKVNRYKKSLIKLHKLDALIVGSDQVWRPLYNSNIYHNFLSFSNNKIKKLSYSASFGVNKWELTKFQTTICKFFIKKFCAVSVREDSGVDLCKQYFQIDATKTLDPTLLLDQADYNILCESIEIENSNFLSAYILDMTDKKRAFIEDYAKFKGLEVKYAISDSIEPLKISEWLSLFRYSSFVITDSFHGTVFSIIYNKEFISLANNERGYSRFESLLNSLGLNSRLSSDYNTLKFESIDWAEVNKIISISKLKSINFLIENLNK